jgi:hypothetical protein
VGRRSRNKRVPGAGLWRTTTDLVKPAKRARATVDILPQALPALPPSIQGAPTTMDSNQLVSSLPATISSADSWSAQFQEISTPRNAFGLWRKFFAKSLPSHDPEELATLENLCDIETPTPSHNQGISFGPYPNESSFLLGEWYWDDDSAQKSHKSFNRLLKIVGDPKFRPEDVQSTKWKSIDTQLASKTYCEAGGDEEWLDAGWETTEIKVSVPFPRGAKHPGPHEYTVGTLYHRSIVDIIQEKFSNPHDSQHYHYDPFELFWSPQEGQPNSRVHGELYTSPAFLEEHHKIQGLAVRDDWREYPRHVVALMFASDVTHLTSFGTAYLWPCYMYFGNESKYRRSQPSCRTASHIAYFQKVLYCCSLLYAGAHVALASG